MGGNAFTAAAALHAKEAASETTVSGAKAVSWAPTKHETALREMAMESTIAVEAALREMEAKLQSEVEGQMKQVGEMHDAIRRAVRTAMHEQIAPSAAKDPRSPPRVPTRLRGFQPRGEGACLSPADCRSNGSEAAPRVPSPTSIMQHAPETPPPATVGKTSSWLTHALTALATIFGAVVGLVEARAAGISISAR